ncbi:uncharacterized protein LOC122094410 [Macadamia integrifolia]|uniref:uncharacterized protein LOC122094410 n=1 Tax=Macadamia integrifolia TaxID=60698 RepID=UPI001C4F3C24|nr:uncharacterized protein LOC122094410 [Macadamia integrifolia]
MAFKGNKKVASAAEASSKPGNPKSLKPKRKIVKKISDRTKDSTAEQIQGKPNHENNTNESIEESKKVGPAAEASSRPLSSKPGNPKSLKLKRKIVKKKNAINQTKNGSKKNLLEVNREKNIIDENSRRDREDKEELGGNAINQTKNGNKKKSKELNREKIIINENCQRDQKDKEELGGLIFFCNEKTKLDCFRYGVMGVPQSQKELVMGIKPGLKLFLYDFDLKLMYGIYKASFAGGLKLEPAAFGGAFPVQVRFMVHRDCSPLPESVFKRAIEDNYDEKKHRFKTELTVLQVKKLTSLFQTSPHVQSTAHFIQAPLQQQLRAPPMPTLPAGEVSEGRKDLPHHATKETFLSDPYSLDGGRLYFLPSEHISGQLSRKYFPTHTVGAPTLQEEAINLDPLFLTEKEYRTYGLSRERRTFMPSTFIDRNAPMVDLYQKDHEREQLVWHAGPQQRETTSKEIDQVRRDPLFLSEKDYRSYGLGQEPPSLIPHAAVATSASTVTYAKVPNYPHHYDSISSDAYFLAPRSEATSSEPYPLVPRKDVCLTNYDYQERGSTDFSRSGADGGGLYSRYAANALSDYNEKHNHPRGRHELASSSVSSQYSFGGPSLTYC